MLGANLVAAVALQMPTNRPEADAFSTAGILQDVAYVLSASKLA